MAPQDLWSAGRQRVLAVVGAPPPAAERAQRLLRFQGVFQGSQGDK
jgi:hypothetical protein